MGRGRTREEEAQTHVHRWRSSGQTRAEYCARHGLNVHTFDGWRRKAEASVTLVPLTVRDAARAVPSAGTAMVLTCGEGVRLELNASVPAAWLVEVLRGLSAC